MQSTRPAAAVATALLLLSPPAPASLGEPLAPQVTLTAPLTAEFTPAGLRVRPLGSTAAEPLGLDLARWGRPGDARTVYAAHPTRTSTRIEYARGELTEWYVELDRGIEQGFTVHARPPGDGALEVELAPVAGLRPIVQPGARDARLVDASDRTALTYTGLLAWDAGDVELDARLETRGERLVIVVDDRSAHYPVTIDPVVSVPLWVAFGDGPDPGNRVGASVSVSGDRFAVGAPGLDPNDVTDAGEVTVIIDPTGAFEISEARASDAEVGDELGSAVAIDGSTLLAGARLEDAGGTDAGAAYVFTHASPDWIEQAKLVASDAAAGDRFGSSAGLDGDTAVVGAPFAAPVGAGSGAAYVFVRSGTAWSQQAKLVASDAAVGHRFAASVSVSGDTILVGAPGDDDAGADSGSAYVFTRSGTVWSQQAKLTSSSPAAGGRFGESVALDVDDEDGAICGAPGLGNGAADVFTRAGGLWSHQQHLVASDGAAGDRFGSGVALSADTAAVGAPGDDGMNPDAGSVYVFTRTGSVWTQANETFHVSPSWGAGLGHGVALHVDAMVAGGPDHFQLAADQGTATGWDLCRVDVIAYCTAGTTANGCAATVSTTGSPSASAGGGFVVSASGVDGLRSGTFFYGINGPIAVPWGMGGTSTMCVAPPRQRTGGLNSGGTSGACDGTLSFDFNAYLASHPSVLGQPFSGGDSVWMQAWFRDPPSVKTTALSNAIEFQLCP